jgi:hypothetical protein
MQFMDDIGVIVILLNLTKELVFVAWNRTQIVVES